MGNCGNSLFGKASQYIKVNAGDFIAVEGSTVAEKMILSDLRMPYKQILKGRVVLKPGQINYLLNHLGVGDNATFLSIKATYDPKSVIELDNYVSYSYYDYPVQSLTFAQLLVLTGNSSNRIPQLYLNNPNTKYPVILDVMIGVLDDTYTFFNDDINQSGSSFTGLEYTDIESFVVGESIVIYDKNTPKRPLIYLGISNINSIILNSDFLIIDDESYGSIFLQFLTEYDATQARSLLSYILENPNTDIDTLSLDVQSPIIYFNETSGIGGDYINFNGATQGVPYNTSFGYTFSTNISLSIYGTAGVINKEILKSLLIDYIEDNRDGVLDILESEIIINNSSDINTINTLGTYSISFDFSDLASNNLQDVIVNINII